MANFLSALDTPMDQIERPKPIPTGTYISQAMQASSKTQNTKDGEKEILEIPFKLVAPQTIDDPSKLEGFDVAATRPLRKSFWFSIPATAEELWAYSQFAKNTMKMETSGKSVKQVAAEMVGRQALATVGNNIYTDKNTNEPVIGSQITAMAPL